MSTEEPPNSGELEFAVSFDPYSQVHCAGRVEDAVFSTDRSVHELFEGVDCDDPEEVHRFAASILEELDADADSARFEAVEDICSQLERCANHSCDCADWARESYTEDAAMLLDELGGGTWAVLGSSDEGRGVHYDNTLTLEVLFDNTRVSRNYGFDSFELSYTNGVLHATFGGYPWGHDSLTLHKLTDTQQRAYQMWVGTEELAAEVLPNRTDEVLDAACDAVEADDDLADQVEFHEVIEVIEAFRSDLSSSRLRLALEMLPGWPSSPQELIDACAELAAA